MKIGVIFGGKSREREISFSGAKTVIKCLDKRLYEVYPIFLDSFGNFILLNDELLKEPNIRSFYPPKACVNEKFKDFSLYTESLASSKSSLKFHEGIGKFIPPIQLSEYMDFAFLLVHGTYAEDGSLQGFLEFMNIRYSGSNIYSSALSINKILQKRVLEKHSSVPKYETFSKNEWFEGNQEELFEKLKKSLGLPIVFKAPNQGSSIGIKILKNDDFKLFREAVNAAFFIKEIRVEQWKNRTDEEKHAFLQEICELDKDISFPALSFQDLNFKRYFEGKQLQYHPLYLWKRLDHHFDYFNTPFLISSFDSEEFVLAESFIRGKEFSCGVVRLHNGQLIALPPTEITSPNENYDFEAKYSPGGSKKHIPIRTTIELNKKIGETVKAIFEELGCNVYARIDGFLTDEGEIYVTDTNNIPGMSPTSLIFRQAAEIGLNPTQFLNHIVLQSIHERSFSGKKPYHARLAYNNLALEIQRRNDDTYPKELIIFGDDSDEETYARVREDFNYVYAMGNYIPVVIFRRGKGESAKFWHLPPSFLLRASVKEINDDVEKEIHKVVQMAIEEAKDWVAIYAKSVFFKPIPLTLEELKKMGCRVKKLNQNHIELD